MTVMHEISKDNNVFKISFWEKQTCREIARADLIYYRTYYYLAWVYTDPAYRRRGFSKLILEIAEKIAWDTPIVLHVGVSNYVALKLYKDMGYRIIPSHVYVVDGDHNVHTMVKELQ